MINRGNYTLTYSIIIGGGSLQKKNLQISHNIDGFRQTIHKAFRIHKTLWTKPIRDIFIFTIYQKYNLYLVFGFKVHVLITGPTYSSFIQFLHNTNVTYVEFHRGARILWSFTMTVTYTCTVKAPVFGTLNSAISNFHTWFVRTVMEVLKYCWM